MNLRRVAIRNVWRNRGRYLAYWASAVFAVMVFFLFNALLLHPDLQGGYRGAHRATQAMEGGSVVVAVFTFLFLLYANSAFISFRKQEFGLLRLLGVTRGQLVRLLLWEGLIIAATAVAIGCGAGLLFMKLFFMAVSVIMQMPQPLPLYAGTDVWSRTAAVFGCFFLFISLVSMRGVLRDSIVDLLRARRRPKAPPVYSRWKAVLGLALVVGGYVWATSPNPSQVTAGITPVTLMVSLGTYFLVNETSIALLTGLHRKEGWYYRPLPFLNVSRLMFKIQDNAKTLTAVALLVAVILTAVGTIYSIFAVVREDVRAEWPHAFEVSKRQSDELTAEIERVEEMFRRHGLTIRDRWQFTGVTADVTFEGVSMPVIFMPYSLYRDLREAEYGEALPLTTPEEAILVTVGETFSVDGQKLSISIGGETLALSLKLDSLRRLFLLRTWVLVLDDAVFAEALAASPMEDRIALAAWETDPDVGRAALEAYEEGQELLSAAGEDVYLDAIATRYFSEVSTWAVVLFTGSFASLVFFAACCSLLYFRLFTEIDDDRKYFRRLRDLGVDQGLLQQVSRRQALVVFFVPFAVGVVHSTFAMYALGTLVGRTVLHHGWLVAVMYLALYVVYFAIMQGFYWRSLRVGSSTV